MPSHLIIVNPISGRGFASHAAPLIKERLDSAHLDYELVFSERPWHAAELAEDAASRGVDIVVSASGDGTANEVLNGLMRAQEKGFNKTAMGIIAVGTGNDFAYGMGIPSGVEDGCRIIVENFQHLVDVGRVIGGDFPSGRYFGNGVGVGFDAATGFVAAKIRWTRGLLLYLIAALETIFIYYKAPITQITYDEMEITQASLMVSIMNGRRMGGGFFFAPNGDPTDGKFDLCIAEALGKLRVLTLIPYFMKGTQATQKEVKTGYARKVVVKALKGTLPVHCDGETVCYEGDKIEIELLPSKIQFITQKVK